MAQIKNRGQVTTTAGSNIVDGIEADWLAGEIKENDLILFGFSTVAYYIQSFDPLLQRLILMANVSVTSTGTDYVISTDFTPNLLLPYLNTGDLRGADILTRALLILDTIGTSPNSNVRGSFSFSDLDGLNQIELIHNKNLGGHGYLVEVRLTDVNGDKIIPTVVAEASNSVTIDLSDWASEYVPTDTFTYLILG